MNDFFTVNKRKLVDFVRMSNALGSRVDYVQGGGGNTSVKLEDGQMAIKASGYTLSDIKANTGYAVLDYPPLRDFYMNSQPDAMDDVEARGSGQAKQCTLHIDGLADVRPSVEAGFHSILPDFVAHSHSVYANLAACADQGENIAAKVLDGAGYSWAFVPYTDPGARLTFSIRDIMRSVYARTGAMPQIVFLQNHGVIAADDDWQRCLDIHDDANQRLAQHFGIAEGSYPSVAIKQDDAGFLSDTSYLKEHLASGAYNARFFTEQALYPDQLVFLLDTLVESNPAKNECAITAGGSVRYNMDAKQAQVIEETLTAIVFIVEHIKQAEYTLSTMGEAARSFIENWESEKYRKGLTK